MDAEHGIEAAASERNRLLPVAQKRLSKFTTAFPTVLISGDAESIHATRVASRRMQQMMNLLFPPPRSGKSRKIARSLRKVRRALGPCRNLDVILNLIQEKLDTASSEIAKDTWMQLRNMAIERRAPELPYARDALKQTDIVKFVTRVMTLIEGVDAAKEIAEQLKQQTESAFGDWIDSLAAAQENRQETQIHGLRIAGKRVRYSAELLAELGDSEMKATIKPFKALQDQLGRWHDLQGFMEFVAKFITQPEFLLNHPDQGRYLLTEIERERQKTTASMDVILENASQIRNQWVEQRLKNSP